LKFRVVGQFDPRVNLPQTRLFRQFGFTFPDSRLYGNLPKTQIDLSRSMSDSADITN